MMGELASESVFRNEADGVGRGLCVELSYNSSHRRRRRR